MKEKTPKVRDCKVCLIEHDEEIHAATLEVHTWFEFQVTKNFEPDAVETVPAA